MAHTVSCGLLAPGLAMWSGLLIADELQGSWAGLTSLAAVVLGHLDSLLGCQPLGHTLPVLEGSLPPEVGVWLFTVLNVSLATCLG